MLALSFGPHYCLHALQGYHKSICNACCGLQKSLDRYTGILCEARKKKGMTEQQARDSLQDINVYGTLMVLAGDADGMVSGATTTTANTIRPALQVRPTVQH